MIGRARIRPRTIAVVVAMMAAASPSLAEGNADRGKTIFNRCTACHSVTGQDKVGPHLNGIVGRKAGSVAGAHYSKALVNAAITWDDASLDAFLTAPAKFVPGTSMTVSVPNKTDRDDLIAYLKSLQ
ncbi:cytochrome c family protein [Mesorhizobium sp. B2-4-15]|uniref:c-type cytochrome n=1 Tax=Mesorhizobium sp. B2-4-15 TaxID=2589934 RepID=UPI0015EFBBF5|nr:cytochrome c family protein [Mesorhizobium sp. B2-4-15]